MAWIESHQELGSHPKTRKLARLLGINRAAVVGHLHFLWWWAMDYADDGDLSGFDDLDVAVGAEWEGDAAAFVAALTKSGFLDADRRIHDWGEYGGKLSRRRKHNAERMRVARAAPSPDTESVRADAESARATHVQCTQRARVGLQDSTVQERTGPDDDARGGAREASSSSPVLDLVDGSLPAIVADFRAMHPTLSESWLVGVFAEAGCRAPPGRGAVLDAVAEAAELTAHALATASAERPIRNPPGFARRLILDKLAAAAEGAGDAPG